MPEIVGDANAVQKRLPRGQCHKLQKEEDGQLARLPKQPSHQQEEPEPQPQPRWHRREHLLRSAGNELDPSRDEIDPSRARQCLRVRLGTLDFHCNAGLGIPALFETSGMRVQLHFGASAPVRWVPYGPTTVHQQFLKFSRQVSRDGRYGVRVACEFDEEIDLPWPVGHPPTELAADVWLEKRTMAERLDSLLERVGLGNDLPEYERTWLGRALCRVPEQGDDVVPQGWQVLASADAVGPVPQALTVGFEWVLVEVPADDGAAGESGGAAGASGGDNLGAAGAIRNAVEDAVVPPNAEQVGDEEEESNDKVCAKPRRARTCCAWSPLGVC